MKRLYLSILSVFFLFVTTGWADAVILEFSGTPSQQKIVLNWKTGLEENIDLFMVERSTNNEDFTKVGEVTPKGSNNNYEFIDNNISEVQTSYYYRLKIRRRNGTFQMSASIVVSPKVSSILRTWGSIKALFQ